MTRQILQEFAYRLKTHRKHISFFLFLLDGHWNMPWHSSHTHSQKHVEACLQNGLRVINASTQHNTYSIVLENLINTWLTIFAEFVSVWFECSLRRMQENFEIQKNKMKFNSRRFFFAFLKAKNWFNWNFYSLYLSYFSHFTTNVSEPYVKICVWEREAMCVYSYLYEHGRKM